MQLGFKSDGCVSSLGRITVSVPYAHGVNGAEVRRNDCRTVVFKIQYLTNLKEELMYSLIRS